MRLSSWCLSSGLWRLQNSGNNGTFDVCCYGRLKKALSNEGFLRSMRQLLSLTMIRIGYQRSFQTGFYQGQRDSRQFRSITEAVAVLAETAEDVRVNVVPLSARLIRWHAREP